MGKDVLWKAHYARLLIARVRRLIVLKSFLTNKAENKNIAGAHYDVPVSGCDNEPISPEGAAMIQHQAPHISYFGETGDGRVAVGIPLQLPYLDWHHPYLGTENFSRAPPTAFRG